MKRDDINTNDKLLSYFLPKGILDYFEVVDFTEEVPSLPNTLYDSVLNIYLDERDNRTPDMLDSISNGFGEEFCLNDFPARDKKTILHLRRRRWLMSNGSTRYVDIDNQICLRYPGTRYSNEFALFLKMANG